MCDLCFITLVSLELFERYLEFSANISEFLIFCFSIHFLIDTDHEINLYCVRGVIDDGDSVFCEKIGHECEIAIFVHIV